MHNKRLVQNHSLVNKAVQNINFFYNNVHKFHIKQPWQVASWLLHEQVPGFTLYIYVMGLGSPILAHFLISKMDQQLLS